MAEMLKPGLVSGDTFGDAYDGEDVSRRGRSGFSLVASLTNWAQPPFPGLLAQQPLRDLASRRMLAYAWRIHAHA